MDEKILDHSITSTSPTVTNPSLRLLLTSSVSKIEPWGRDWAKRDRQLAEFFLEEPFLTSAVYNIATTRSALSWELDGPPRTVKQTKDMLMESDKGGGWISLMFKVAVDLLTQDNGAFVEIVRKPPARGRRPEAMPVLGMVHLSSRRCVRTGDPREPVIYTNKDGDLIPLKWYQVITFEEMPHPSDDFRGRQISFVTRVLKAAEIIKEITKYKEEKVSGRFNRALHLVGGVAQHEIEDIQNKGQLNADNMGLTKYMQPIILASLDPNAKVSHEQIDMATLPDAFDEEVTMKWYITLLAMASGGDFQDFAPLPGGNLGTASQSETLHRKSRIKGTQLWMKLIEHKLHYHKVIPSNVTFRYLQQDAAAEAEQVEIAKNRAQERQIRIASEEITPEIARQIAVDTGDLKQEYLVQMNEVDSTPSVAISDDEDVSQELLDQEESMKGKGAEIKAVGIKPAAAAASWWRGVIEQSPIQAVSPIPPSKLNTFEDYLRGHVKEERVISTSTGWQDFLLTRAAYESGIHPNALRLRLPDNYKVFVYKDKVIDSAGTSIYRAPKQKENPLPSVRIASGNACYSCGGQHEMYCYLPLRGWVSSCGDHVAGLVGKSTKYQAGIEELIKDFKDQFDRSLGLLLSTYVYAYELGSGKRPHVNNFKEQVEGAKKLVEYAPADTFVPSILAEYYKGVTHARNNGR